MSETDWYRFLQQQGGQTDDSGWVVSFGHDAEGYRLAHHAAVLADRSAVAKIELTGSDAIKLVQNLATNDVEKLDTGQGCEAFFPNAKGRILDYVTLYRSSNGLWVDATPGRGEVLIAHLDRYIIREDVQLHDRTTDYAQFLLTGPRAEETLNTCFETIPKDAPSQVEASYRNIACWLRRVERARQPSFEILSPRDDATVVWQAIVEAGNACGLALVGSNVTERLRIEAGLPAFGQDVTDANLPQEVGRIDKTISFTKGCYLGQETVARIDSHGHVNRLMRGLVMEAIPEDLTLPAEIELDGKRAGQLTSVAAIPGTSGGIGLAILRTAVGLTEEPVGLTIGERVIPAAIMELPLPVT